MTSVTAQVNNIFIDYSLSQYQSHGITFYNVCMIIFSFNYFLLTEIIIGNIVC